ncbi:uncharacterized protein LOC125231078 [Leguminivora glycinivorella]|uniref:uncharacterized protein LOC125231078 n=1 Tax=Leguminivora glycinivorella TaxID=1035111 RepID=UPI00200EE3C4|nr:uncharacterized protein LOC125231078 [Leguminivora glycinivorella]
MFKIVVFLSVIFTVILKANGLQCYVCYDCLTVSDDYLKSCDSLLPTSTAQPDTTTSTESTSSNSTTNTTTTTTIAPQLQVSNSAERLERANTTWECVQGTIPVNGSDVIVRGCAAGRTNETCDMFGLHACSFCSKDKCNSAGSVQVSAAVLAIAFFAYIVKDF